jgi:cell division protein FtsB
MGGSAKAPDNSAQIAAANAQQMALDKQNKDLQRKKEAIQTQATSDYNAKRRGLVGRQTLITTSERGVLGATDKVG